MLQVLVFLVMLACAQSTTAAVVEVSPSSDLRAAIAALSPGDELVLGGGTYTMSSRFNFTVVGLTNQPIIIRAKVGEVPVIYMNTINQNIVEVQGSRYLTLRGLHFRGGSHGIRLMDSSFVTIEDCEVYETDDVGISANSGGTYEGLVIRRNNIHHTSGTGEGMYLGCNSNACRVANSLIEGNYVHHTNGPAVTQGDGIELKEGSYGNIIRDNVVHDTNYPGILSYGTVGNGAANIIEGNLIWNTNDFAIQSAADSVIRNNIILGGTIGLQPHQASSPSNVTIAHNTIVGTGNGIEVRGVTGAVVIANNAVYSQSGTAIALISGNTSLVTVVGNIGAGGISGSSTGFANGKGIALDFVGGNYNGAVPVNLFPAAGSALIGAGSAAHVVPEDFNRTARSGVPDVGAYKYESGGNPGWTLTNGFKTFVTSLLRPNPPGNVRAN
jgi:hypothetical protein